MEELVFDDNRYEVKTIEIDGKKLVYRAFENISYVTRPKDSDMQRLSIYVPETYYEGKNTGKYSLKTAPIFMPNTVGGYMPGPQEGPGKNFMGETNATFYALLHGYVVVSAGARGRMMKNEKGDFIGTAPAGLCDLKAAVRYLRFNKERVPGNTDRIITNGTSAGGAMSSLLGSTGNHPDYDSYMEEMGAADAQDHVFASSCYCPITNLDHADMAYEWEFCGQDEYHCVKIEEVQNGEAKRTPVKGTLTEEQKAMSEALKKMFPSYLNSLGLTDENGNLLTLDENGNGSFKDYVLSYVKKSAEQEAAEGTDLSGLDWIVIEEGKVKKIDFDRYISFRTRMKITPAFDAVHPETAENELFGSEKTQFRHFTDFSFEHDKDHAEMAEPMQIKMMNPMEYIGDSRAKKAEHFRIRHGSVDRDTSLAISAMLTARLRNNGIDVDLAYPWGKPHCGDYDMGDLFAWIDSIVQ